MIKDILIKALQNASHEAEISLEIADSAEHGDYSTNVALKGKNPREFAQKIVEQLKKDSSLAKLVDRVEIAGPGFINFWLSGEELSHNVKEIVAKGDKYGQSEAGKGKKVIVEYSSPNIAKRFGIGHLRSTIIGQAIYNLYKFIGYETVGENHLGDWGTQFGVILAIVSKHNLEAEKLDIDTLERYYVEYSNEAKDNPQLWEEAKSWFKKLETGDKQAREIWEKVKKISLEEFGRIYTRLGVKIDHSHGESFYEDKIPAIVKEVREKGLSKKSQGAEIMEFSKTTGLTPGMLIKADGTSTYFTRDLAAIKYRIEEWRPDSIIYEVGSDQILHFRQLFEAARMLGWDKNLDYKHVAHGLYRFKEGKMSTRRGTGVKLEEVLDEAIHRAKKIIETSKTGRGLSLEQKKEVSEAVGIGAIKYYDLMHHPVSDIVFEWEKIFVLEGNSAPYIQYTFARALSVVKKSKDKESKGSANTIDKDERLILRELFHFSEIVENAAKNYSPNILINYLFNLSQQFNSFYNSQRIIGSEKEHLRLMLTKATAQVLKNGLNLLGIQAPEVM